MPKKDLSVSTSDIYKQAQEGYDKAKKSGASIQSQQATRERMLKSTPTSYFGLGLAKKSSPQDDFRRTWNRAQQKDNSVMDGSARARQSAIAKKLK